jgi:hypothetical protein
MKTSIFTLAAAVACMLGSAGLMFAGSVAPVAAPEPGTILLVAGAGGALILVRKLRKNK